MYNDFDSYCDFFLICRYVIGSLLQIYFQNSILKLNNLFVAPNNMELVPSTSRLSYVEEKQRDKGENYTNYSEPIADIQLGQKNYIIVAEKNSDDFIKIDTYQANPNEECNLGINQSLPVAEVLVYPEFSRTHTNQVGLLFPNSLFNLSFFFK